MRINFRQGIVSYQDGGFLQVSGNVVSILATNRPTTISVAHKNTNYTHSEDNTVNTAWIGPFTEPKYWLYWDFNPLTFERTFGKTSLEPVAQSVEPGNGNSDILGVIPGAAGIGAFVVGGYYDLATNRPFAIVNSTANDGNYSVKSITYNTSTGETTIFVNEEIISNIADGVATLDFDTSGIPLFTDGRHWFNTTTNIHYVLDGTIWRQVLRVFSAILINGVDLQSVSQNAPLFSGTQVGNNNAVLSGRILFDEAGDPIRRDDGTFFTTEDQFFTNQSRVDALRLESNVTRAQSVAAALPEFSVVAWVDSGKVNLAQYNDSEDTVVGMLTESILINEVGGIIVQGTVTNPIWNWTSTTPVGSPLWIQNGVLVSVDPHISDPVTYPIPRVPVAKVLSQDTVIFEQGLGGVGPQGPPGTVEDLQPADTTNLGGVTLLTASSDPARAFVISDTDSRLTNARAPTAHTHIATDVSIQPISGITASDVQSALSELQTLKLDKAGGAVTGDLSIGGNLSLTNAPSQPLHATTKDYVDNLVNGLIWLDPIDGINLISDVIDTPPAAPNHGDSYLLPGPGNGAWTGFVTGEVAQWDNNAETGSPPVVTGEWKNLGPIQNIHTGNVRAGIAMASDTVPSGSFAGEKNNIAIFDGTTGAFLGIETVVLNNAVYVDGDSSLFAFDQYVFDGTSWVKFGGSNTPIVGDELTITISGNKISAIPSTSGGIIDALSIDGKTFTDLNALWSPVGHTHAGSNITFVPYAGNGLWGTPNDPNAGKISDTDISAAIEKLADKKAEKTPLYSDILNLPATASSEGMLATVLDGVNDTVYFADTGAGWTALARADHVHNIPYDMNFYVTGVLTANKNIGMFLITRPILVAANAPSSLAVTSITATTLPTTLNILRDSAPYGTPVNIGTITFAVGSNTGVISWPSGVSFAVGDRLIIATDASPSDIEEITISIVGCAAATACTGP